MTARIADVRCVLAVQDLEKSTRYWVDVLGFTKEPIPAPGWSFLVRDRFKLMLGECADDRAASELENHSWFAYLYVEGLDDYHAEIAARGAEITAPPADKPWGLREFAMRTPDGHRITCGWPLSND